MNPAVLICTLTPFHLRVTVCVCVCVCVREGEREIYFLLCLGVAAGSVSGGLLGRKIYKSSLPPQEIELEEMKKTK